MKSQFAIFGLEKTPDPKSDDGKSGQPYLFKRYPEWFGSYRKAKEELEKINEGNSPFVHYQFNAYVILEVFSKKN